MKVILMILTAFVTEQCVRVGEISCNSGVLNSGITARTPNIFSVFLFDYTLQFHTNGLLTTQFRP